MSAALPEHLHPLRLARSGHSLAGRMTLERLQRIAEMVPHPDAYVDFELDFHTDERGQARVHGSLEARLQVRCQRCLEPLFIEVARTIRLGLVQSDSEAARLEADYEPLLVGAEPVLLADMVEDELILALPSFPCHARGACAMPGGEQGPDPSNGAAAENPFRVLEALKPRRPG